MAKHLAKLLLHLAAKGNIFIRQNPFLIYNQEIILWAPVAAVRYRGIGKGRLCRQAGLVGGK